MDLRQLRYFVVVAEMQHFRRAAELLHITQPALSRHIKLMEHELGVSLFERLPRGVRLTDSGRVYLRDVKHLVEEFEAAGHRARRTARGDLGTLRIGFSEATAGHDILTRGIHGFRIAHPEVELILVPLTSSDQVEALRLNRIDAGVQFRLGLAEREFHRAELALENVFLALPNSHRLTKQKAIAIADLQDEPLICVAQRINPQFYGAVMAAFFAARIAPRIVQEASSSVVVSLVATGMGLGIISSAMRWHLPAGIALRAVTGLSLIVPLDFVWRKDDASPALTQFRQTLIQVAAATPKVAAGTMRKRGRRRRTAAEN